jgi:hypothetical protein
MMDDFCDWLYAPEQVHLTLGRPVTTMVPPEQHDTSGADATMVDQAWHDRTAANATMVLQAPPPEATNVAPTNNLSTTASAPRDPTRQRGVVAGALLGGAVGGQGGEESLDFPSVDEHVPGGGLLVYQPDLKVFIQGLGTLGKDAIEVRIFGGEGAPVSAEGLVIEPVELEEEAKKRLEEELRRLAAENPITAKLDLYCLEFLRQPPDLGTVFRVADQAVQQQFAAMGRVLSAGQRLHDAGLLNPDSDPEEYFHSIRQWALWTVQENLDAGSFGDAFLEHTRKNFEIAGQPWTGEVEELVKGLVPNRWQDIARIVEEARSFPGAASETGGE